MIDDIGDVVAEMLRGDVDRMQPRAGLIDGSSREGALVIAGVVSKSAVKAVGEASRRLAGEDRDEAGIDAAGNIRTDWNVAAQMQIDRIVEEFGQAAFEIALVMLEIDVIPDVPVPPYRDLPVFDRQRVPGQQLLDAAEQRGRADRVLERQVFGERGRIGVDL